MSELPYCIHRGAEVSEDRFVCTTDRLSHRGVVPGSVCRDRCHVVNKPLLESRGVGDSIHKVTHALGIDTVVHKLVGDCGCKGRKDWLNKIIPYRELSAQTAHELCTDNQPASRIPFTAEPVRNLLMYVYPIAEFEVWRWNIAQIRQRMHLFNGKRIVTVMTDHRTNTVEDVQAAFCDERIDQWVVGQNDPTRWEMQGLPSMLSLVHSCDQNEMTFYCHAKGVQGPEHIHGRTFHEQPRVKWATAMYGSCLDNIGMVEKALVDNVFAGSFKRRMVHDTGAFRSSWHFAGTFYWFRNCKLFALPNWHGFNQEWYGAETYPGQLVGWGQAAGLFCDHPPILYLQEAWTGQVDRMWAEWKEKHLCTPAS